MDRGAATGDDNRIKSLCAHEILNFYDLTQYGGFLGLLKIKQRLFLLCTCKY
jgi:hypothetical protein